MTSRSKSALQKSALQKSALQKSALRKSAAQRKSSAAKSKTISKSKTITKAGKLPEWNLADLYSGIDAPEVARDLAKMDTDCVAFETDYKGKPYQLEDRVEQLFHEKSQSGYAAWNRLFDQTISGLRFKVGGKELAIEPALNFLQDRDGAKRKAAGEALAKTFKANERTFALVTNTLAKDKEISDRWRGFADVADSRHLNNRVEREVVDALVSSVRAAYPKLSHRYYKLKAGWFKKKKLAHWDRNAPLPFAATGTIAWPEAQKMVLTAYHGFSAEMASIAERFFTDRWIDAPVRPGKAP